MTAKIGDTPTALKRETRLPAAPASVRAARSIVCEAAAEAGLGEDCTRDLMLATSEAVANAVQHGTPWPDQSILLTTTPCGRGLCIEVINRGACDRPLEPAPLEATSGRGIQIIAAVVDRLEMQNDSGHTVVRFEKHKPRLRSAASADGSARAPAAASPAPAPGRRGSRASPR
jgi:serine/threonine-protein kinase RsbW